MSRFGRNRDYYAGALMAMIGAAAAVQGWQYGMGGLANMGSGFFPVTLGVGLIVMGGLMALFAAPAPDATAPGFHAAGPPDWRGAAAITGGVALFIGLANSAGLLAAIFACVFVAALGTRQTTWRQAAMLAACVAVFGVLLFSYGLKVQFPIVRGVM